MTNVIQRIKEEIPLLELVKEYVPLKKKGTRWMAPCPFHRERTASFGVRNEHYWHCFGCGVGGSVIDFYMAIEGISLGAAIKALAARAGIPLDSRPVTRAQRAYDREEREFCAWWQARTMEGLQATLTVYVGSNLTTEDECEALGSVLRQVRAVRGQELRALVERCATSADRREYADRAFREDWLSIAATWDGSRHGATGFPLYLPLAVDGDPSCAGVVE